MISALRGWRHKKRQTFEEWNRDFTKWLKASNKRALMVKVNGVSYGRRQYIHKGKKP